MSARGARAPLVAAVLILLPVVTAAIGLSVGGASSLSALDSMRVLVGAEPRDVDPGIARAIVLQVRGPRVALLLLAGVALAASGVALQACLQNPLADPGLLGLASGASFGAVAAITSGAALVWPASVPLAAFAGALVAIAIVYALAHAAGRPTTGALLLTGVAVGSLASAGVAVLLLAAGAHRVHEIFHWLLGSAEGRSLRDLALALPPVAIGVLGLLAYGRVIDALALGEEHAYGAGVDVTRARAVVLALVAVTAGGAVGVVGPIGFVGLMVPHAVRTFVGSATRRLLPASALAGAGFLVGCDALSRVLSRSVDVPIGVITALCGVPFFLLLLHRRRSR